MNSIPCIPISARGWSLLLKTLCFSALILLASSPVQATSLFDPGGEPEAAWDSPDPVTTDLDGLPLWDRVERLSDPDPSLFVQEDFSAAGAWSDSSPFSPHVATAFGSSTPHSRSFLLHFAPGWALAPEPYPVLLIPGAGASASGVFPVLARYLAGEGRSVFALTFPHPHGDVFQDAEAIADAIARILSLTGAEKVDLIAHSKGGIAASVYLAHVPGWDWSEQSDTRGGRYTASGTPFRGDVRRFIAAGVPFQGVDTAFRWTAAAVATATAGSDALTPYPFTAWYPYTTGNLLASESLQGEDLWPEGGDPFPGQAQILAPWEDVHPLPGSRVELGILALQQDWYTVWNGGFGLYTYSPGFASAMEAGGEVILHLAAAGIDPSVEVAILAGAHPLVPLSSATEVVDPFGAAWDEFLGQGDEYYADLWEGVLAEDFPDLTLTADDMAGLRSGDLMMGEVSGLSDGVVFWDSATASESILHRGAPLLETRTVVLSHLDLLMASAAVGEVLVAHGEEDPNNFGYLRSLGARYIEADTVAWMEEILSSGAEPGDDDSSPPDDDTASDDDSTPLDDDTSDDDTPSDDDDDDAADDDPPPDDLWNGESGCDCDDTGPSSPGAKGASILGILLALRRRHRRVPLLP